MSNVKKLMMTAAGGDATYVEDVFNTTLYTGPGASHSITNGIDLSSNGGLVWTKARTGASFMDHYLVDTERGGNKTLSINNTNAETTQNYISSFNTDGVTYANSTRNGESAIKYTAWTFRKAPKFFDIVTYTGDGQNSRTVSHNLGSVPAVIWIKPTSAAGEWSAVHRTHTNTSTGNFEYVRSSTSSASFGPNRTSTYDTAGAETHITSTSFIPAQVGHPNITNSNGTEYVAYIFAHNDGDGEFGTDADQDIIKCGRFSTNSSGNADVSFGWEPQFLILKRLSSGDWWIVDDMRAWLTYSGNGNSVYSQYLRTNGNNQESNIANADAKNADGLAPRGTYSNTEFAYIAIRRDMKLPESGTDVFAMDYGSSTNPDFTASFDRVDMAWYRNIVSGGAWGFFDRVRGEKRRAQNTSAAEDNFNVEMFDLQNEWFRGTTSTNHLSWMVKRAPSFFDITTWYSGTNANRRIRHNLGVTPEMIWVKNRDNNRNIHVYHKDLGSNDATYGARDYRLYLNAGQAEYGPTVGRWGTSDPTSTDFGLNENDVTGANRDIVAYLWATLPGVSKVGSYTGNGSSQTIDCGFSSGARFVLIKQVNGTASWGHFDSVRGIVSGSDQLLRFEQDTAQTTALGDIIDPHNSGFIVNAAGGTMTNASGSYYIFLAIA